MKYFSLLILALCILSAACSESGEPVSTTDTAIATPTIPDPIPSPSPEPAIEPTFEASSCPFSIPSNMLISCGYVTVPEDHNDPNGSTIRLAVVRVIDQSTNHQPDPVILLTGGPGEKTVHNADEIAAMLAHTHPDRDLIIFDQRGVGLSEPVLDCPGWVQAQYDVLDEPNSDIAMQMPFEALMQCHDELVEQGVNLSAYTTTQSAADVDAIRRALGYEQLNLLGGSYGSFLAQAVARDFPEILRSMVINSIWPLQESFSLNAPLITYQSIERFLEACKTDPACNEAYPELDEVFYSVVEQLNDQPVQITATHILTGQEYDVLLTGDRVYGSLISFLYQTALIPHLPRAIYDVYEGDYDLITQFQGVALAMYDLMSRGMTYSVFCAEDLINQGPGDVEAVYAQLPDELWEDVDKELAFEYGLFGICAGWDVAEADPSFKQALISDVPTLLLEGEFDPVTPLSYAETVAENLSNSNLFVFPGVGHDVLGATSCAREMIGDFVTNPDRQPDAACIADMQTGFMLPYADPQGRYSVPVPSGWTVSEQEGYLQISSKDESIIASVVVVESEDFMQSSDAAWEIVDPSFNASPNLRQTDCVGCAVGNSRSEVDFALIYYQTGDPDRVTLASAWIYDGLTYLMLWQTDPATVEMNSTLINTIIMGFEIEAVE